MREHGESRRHGRTHRGRGVPAGDARRRHDPRAGGSGPIRRGAGGLAGQAALVVAVGAIALAALACGGGDAGDGQTVVRFVTWRPNQPAVWDEVWTLFEERHPDLVVEREVGPHSSTAFHDMLTQKLKNRSTDVDVFMMDVIWPAEFSAAGWTAPLGDRFTESMRQEFFDGAVEAASVQGDVFGVPLFLAGGMLYYRTDLLDEHGFEPPETWQELVEQAEAIVAAEGGAGGSLAGYSGQFKQYEGLVCNMLELVASNGGRLLSADGRAAAIDEPAALEAVRFARDRLIGPVAPRGALTYEEPESLALFLQGNAVFHRNWPYAWQVAGDPEQSRVAGNVGIAPLPRFPGGESVSTLGGWMVGMSAYSENPDAAWRLVQFLTGPEVQEILAVGASLAPTRKALYEDPEVIDANPQLAGMRDVFVGARPRPRTPLYPAVSNALQRYFSRMISEPDSDLEAGARDVAAEIEQLLALAQQ